MIYTLLVFLKDMEIKQQKKWERKHNSKWGYQIEEKYVKGRTWYINLIAFHMIYTNTIELKALEIESLYCSLIKMIFLLSSLSLTLLQYFLWNKIPNLSSGEFFRLKSLWFFFIEACNAHSSSEWWRIKRRRRKMLWKM